jgi:tetratricopeptide (TPR) repeat protein
LNSAPSQGPAAEPAELARAREAFGSGRYDRAAGHCETVLAARPGAADALTLLGEIEYKRGNAESAAACLDKAVVADRRHARAHWLIGNISQDQGKLDRAITAYRRALRVQPGLAEAHNDLGTAYFAKGWHQEAEQCYLRALELQPDNFAATENLAAVLRAQGRIREARDAFIRALKLRLGRAFRRLIPWRRGRSGPAAALRDEPEAPAVAAAKKLLAAQQWPEAEAMLRARLAESPDDADLLHLLGGALANSGKHDEAVERLQRAISLRSTAPDFHVTLGNVLSMTGRHAKAIEQYQVALMLDPGHGAAAANIARVLHDLGHFREAEEVHRLSLKRDPDTADAHNNLAATLISLGKYAQAEAAARKACELNPRSSHARVMLGASLLEQQRLDEAKRIFDEAGALDPRDPLVLRWAAIVEMTFHADFAAAETILRRGLEIAPQDSGLHINLARTLLIRQRFAEGWEEYEWRKRELSRAGLYTNLPSPHWSGIEAPEGIAVAVVGEQGVGDEIMFAACLGNLAARASRCVLHCNPRLEALFKRSFPQVEVVGSAPARPIEVDYQIAAGSLPRLFRRRAADFPRHDGYLKPDERKVAKWRDRLAALGPGTKVGLSWKGGTPLSDQARRTLRLDDFESLLRPDGTHWINLQYGDCEEEISALRARTGIALHHWREAIDDLDETAALICALDLRVSVCNTLVHLSGALGKEVWVIAPLSPDWRYGHAGEAMLWYPSARMFRQQKSGEWTAVLQRLEQALTSRLAAGT